ncbi:hypothetical protein Tco_0590024 [Tanacetum coccineum]
MIRLVCITLRSGASSGTADVDSSSETIDTDSSFGTADADSSSGTADADSSYKDSRCRPVLQGQSRDPIVKLKATRVLMSTSDGAPGRENPILFYVEMVVEAVLCSDGRGMVATMIDGGGSGGEFEM